MDMIDRAYALASYQDLCANTTCSACPMKADEMRCRLEEWLRELPQAKTEET